MFPNVRNYLPQHTSAYSVHELCAFDYFVYMRTIPKMLEHYNYCYCVVFVGPIHVYPTLIVTCY